MSTVHSVTIHIKKHKNEKMTHLKKTNFGDFGRTFLTPLANHTLAISMIFMGLNWKPENWEF